MKTEQTIGLRKALVVLGAAARTTIGFGCSGDTVMGWTDGGRLLAVRGRHGVRRGPALRRFA
jgi:hypothetical protein